MGLYSEMQECIDAIEINFEMDEDMLTDFDNFENMMSIAQSMLENNLYMGGLSENQIIEMENILTEDRPYMAPIALALLLRSNPQLYYSEHVYDVPQNPARKAEVAITNVEPENSKDFRLYPNPAKDYTTLSYNCQFATLTYTIIDMQGRVLKTNSLETIENLPTKEVLIKLNGLSSGNYQIIIKTDNLVLWNEKLIVSE